MANQTGIAITIKAFLPTGKTLDAQFEALSIVKQAHETSDYGALLAAATIEEVKTEQKTRRVEDAPAPAPTDQSEAPAATADASEPETPETAAGTDAQDADADIPAFIRGKKKVA